MQLYVLDRARNALATTALQYNDLHHMELGAGASTYVFTLDKHDQNGVADPAAQYLVSGNLVVLQDDKKVPWAFTIMSVEEKHDTITATCADVGIELYNKACDAWATPDTHPFEYYFDECTDGTPWELGINQLSDLSRKLVYTGRDTGLGRLLSVLKGFDDAECKFRVEVSGTMPAKFIVDVYKQIGTVQENVVLDYGNEVNEITRTESRAAFVTALQGVGGVVEQKTDDSTPATTDTTVPEVHVDFKDLEYDQDGFYSPKGDPMLYAVTANKQFNPGQESYIENFYDYDTQSASELLNRTLSQLKTLSEPQLTFAVEAKVIDPTLEIGDTVRIVDHSYQPALYLSARVATLERSYSDPSKNTITFTNYAILTADDQLRELQNIVNQLPTNATIGTIVTNVVNAANAEIKQQLIVALTSADGKNTIYYDAKPSTAKENDTAFVKNADGVTEIWRFHNGAWELDIGVATKEQVDQAIQEMDTDVKAAKQQADDAVSAATDAVAKAGFANDAAEQAKTIAEGVATQAANALDAAQTADTNATTALANANKALTAANGVSTTVDGLQQDVDTINAKWSSLATQTSVDALKGTVEDQATTIDQTVAGLALKADQSTVDTINKTVSTQSASLETLAGQVKLKAESSTVDKLNGSVSALSAQVNTQAGQIDLMASKTDVAGMATQSYVQAQTKIVSDSITSTVSSAISDVKIGGQNLIAGSDTDLVLDATNGSDYVYQILYNALVPGQKYVFSADVSVDAGSATTVTMGLFPDNLSGSNVYSVPISNGRISFVFTDASGYNNLLIYAGLQGATAGNKITLHHYQLQLGDKETAWNLAQADQATSSQMTQALADINLRVKTNDVINQINISTESISIDGKKVHITGTTTIDNGVIKNAMIADATINGAKIVDASILSAKIANLDGSKIVANSITADKLSADTILVGLNNGGYGWKFTPEHLGFFQSGATAPSLQLDPEGIVFADVVSMRKLGINYGGPYSVGVDKSYSGIITQMAYGGADFWGVNVEESGGANWNPIMYSRKRMDTFGIFSGLNISAATHFNTIGPMDPDAKAQMKVVRAQVSGRWSTGFMNSNANGGNQSGILFTDDGATYLGRAGKWYNLADIVNKIGIA